MALQFLKVPISHMATHMVFVSYTLSLLPESLSPAPCYFLCNYISLTGGVTTEEDFNSIRGLALAGPRYRNRETLLFSLILLIIPQMPANSGKVLKFIASSWNTSGLWNSICGLHYKYGNSFECSEPSFRSWCSTFPVIVN